MYYFGDTDNYTIPMGITTIEDRAFASSDVKIVNMTNTVNTIKQEAFIFIYELTDIYAEMDSDVFLNMCNNSFYYLSSGQGYKFTVHCNDADLSKW